MTTSHLDFSLRIARSAQDLAQVGALRAQCYGRHLDRGAPAGPERPIAADPLDTQPGSLVLVCHDKASGALIGSARIQRNHPQPLLIERSVALPPDLAGAPCAEITRLAILPGADPRVRPLLVKACYLYAVASQIRWLVIGARSPALLRIYRGLGFAALAGADQPVALAHAGGLLHSVLAFDVVSAERRWHAAGHGLYDFMVQTWHPDLQLLAAPAPRPVAVRSWRLGQPAGQPGRTGRSAAWRPAVSARQACPA